MKFKQNNSLNLNINSQKVGVFPFHINKQTPFHFYQWSLMLQGSLKINITLSSKRTTQKPGVRPSSGNKKQDARSESIFKKLD